jgi:hypothetical protein
MGIVCLVVLLQMDVHRRRRGKEEEERKAGDKKKQIKMFCISVFPLWAVILSNHTGTSSLTMLL